MLGPESGGEINASGFRNAVVYTFPKIAYKKVGKPPSGPMPWPSALRTRDVSRGGSFMARRMGCQVRSLWGAETPWRGGRGVGSSGLRRGRVWLSLILRR